MCDSYVHYEGVWQDYDAQRQPVGVSWLLALLKDSASASSRSMSDLDVLDVGCGTGAYAAALQAEGLRVTGVDADESGVVRARRRCENAANGPPARFLVASATSLPFDDCRFDLVMLNQMLHHLDRSEERGRPNGRAAIAEAHRVLRPDGMLFIQTTLPEQVFDGFWWSVLIPDAVRRIRNRFPSRAWLLAILEELHFRDEATDRPTATLVRESEYLNIEGPFREAYRNADSTWILASRAELDAALQSLSAIISRGESQRFLEEREQARSKVGQTTSWVAYKAADVIE